MRCLCALLFRNRNGVVVCSPLHQSIGLISQGPPYFSQLGLLFDQFWVCVTIAQFILLQLHLERRFTSLQCLNQSQRSLRLRIAVPDDTASRKTRYQLRVSGLYNLIHSSSKDSACFGFTERQGSLLQVVEQRAVNHGLARCICATHVIGFRLFAKLGFLRLHVISLHAHRFKLVSEPSRSLLCGLVFGLEVRLGEVSDHRVHNLCCQSRVRTGVTDIN